jgi:hypothetical protein
MDSIDQIAKNSFGGFLSAVGDSWSTKKQTQAEDTKAANTPGIDWRIVGVVGVAVVGLVVLIMRRK